MNTNQKKNNNNLAKYSGLAFQLLSYLLIGFFIGKFLDTKYNTNQAYFTLGFLILFLVIGLYLVLKDLIKK